MVKSSLRPGQDLGFLAAVGPPAQSCLCSQLCDLCGAGEGPGPAGPAGCDGGERGLALGRVTCLAGPPGAGALAEDVTAATGPIPPGTGPSLLPQGKEGARPSCCYLLPGQKEKRTSQNFL